MTSRPDLTKQLTRLGDDRWANLIPAIEARLAGHGDYPRWRHAVDMLPPLTVDSVELTDTVSVRGAASAAELAQLESALTALHPWRKGPFELFGLQIDSEWRSDWKWARAAPCLGDLSGQSVLDVGCGNGYFGWRAIEAGAAEVVGVDPSVLFYLQHLALTTYLADPVPAPNVLLPVPFEALPAASFDTVLSMGVIYHRKDPQAHVRRLHTFTRPGGRVLLESLIVPDPEGLRPRNPDGKPARYARMRNLSLVPSTGALCDWLAAAGFEDIVVEDINRTSTLEQRRTRWMTFESLAEALDPQDAGKTVEGYPAPTRAIVSGRRPAAAARGGGRLNEA